MSRTRADVLTEAAELVEAAARDGALPADQLAGVVGALRVLAVTWAADPAAELQAAASAEDDLADAERILGSMAGAGVEMDETPTWIGPVVLGELARLRADDLGPGPEQLSREDAARDVARAWALAEGCDTQREQIRYEMPHLAAALDRAAAAHGLAVPSGPLAFRREWLGRMIDVQQGADGSVNLTGTWAETYVEHDGPTQGGLCVIEGPHSPADCPRPAGG